jgi:hypothetical protein
MPKNKMSDLRNHLFETLERLKDDENPMDIDRARAIANVGGTIIESVKAEIQFMEATGEICDAEFFDLPDGAARPKLLRSGTRN